VFVYVFLVTENPIAIGATLSLLLILFSAITNDSTVTITASLDKIPVSDVMPFIISQVLGGLVAVQLFKVKN
jgi:glycerol uptake facilitator-like aquaporin